MSYPLTPTPEERRLRRAIASRVDPLLRQPVALLRPDAVLEILKD